MVVIVFCRSCTDKKLKMLPSSLEWKTSSVSLFHSNNGKLQKRGAQCRIAQILLKSVLNKSAILPLDFSC